MNQSLLVISGVEGVTYEGRHSVCIHEQYFERHKVTEEMVNMGLSFSKDVIYIKMTPGVDDVGIVFNPKKINPYRKDFPISCFEVFTSEDWNPDVEFNMNHRRVYPLSAQKEAVEEFLHKIRVGNTQTIQHYFSEEDIAVMTYGYEAFTSQYSYCTAMLNEFWKTVFNKTPDSMWCGGIVSAHGDKCYGYRDEWQEAGIHFYRGTMLYLLSYTSEYRPEDRSKIGEWVIEQYPKFVSIFEEVEKRVLDKDFTYPPKEKEVAV